MRVIYAAAVALLVSCGTSRVQPESENDSTMNKEAGTADNRLSEAEKNDGWALLFDGKTLNGWHTYLNKKKGGWQVADGQLFLDTSVKENMGVSLLTDEEYEDFHFKTDWKISKAGNSGIMFGVKEDEKYAFDYHTGPEMQVLDNEGHKDGNIKKHLAGDLYDLISSSPKTAKPVGEWNTAEIIKKDSSLVFKLNGTTVMETTLWDEAWKQLLANSKFNKLRDFGTFRSGRISLQDHGDQVWYKNIKLKKL